MSDEASAKSPAAQVAAPKATASTEAPAAAPVEDQGEAVTGDGQPAADAQPTAEKPSQVETSAEKPIEETAAARLQNPAKEQPDSPKPAVRVDAEAKHTCPPSKAAPSEPIADEVAVDATTQADAPTEGITSSAAAAATPKPKDRRKSSGAAASTGKKLNKKTSRPNLLHLNAQPGDHFFVKLKGHPKWPVIICDDDMLPCSLLTTRPVTAKRADGTYRDDFADGGKRAHQRTFPVMYLYTNEFGWVPNADLSGLDPEDCTAEKAEKLKRKDLAQAYELAAEQHPLSYYKKLLVEYQAEVLEAAEAKAAALLAKQKKEEKDEDGDVLMDDEVEEGGGEPKPNKPKMNKRKAEDSAETPARSSSVKKPKIKLLSTPKTTTGASATPRAPSSGEAKNTKSKAKSKKVKEAEEEAEEETVKEPKLSAEEKLQRKGKEVLFLRHRLQKGLITRDSEPKEEEMKGMAEYISKLETFPDLEPSIIRSTKIHKVLKAILKLERIPKEEEFNFKSRSQALWDKWNKILMADGASTSGSAGDAAAAAALAKDKGAAANGVHGEEAAVAVKKEAAVAVKEEAAEAVKEEAAVAVKQETGDEGDTKDASADEKDHGEKTNGHQELMKPEVVAAGHGDED